MLYFFLTFIPFYFLLSLINQVGNYEGAPQSEKNLGMAGLVSLSTLSISYHLCVYIDRTPGRSYAASFKTCSPLAVAGSSTALGYLSWQGKFGQDEIDVLREVPARAVAFSNDLKRDAVDYGYAKKIAAGFVDRMRGNFERGAASLGFGAR